MGFARQGAFWATATLLALAGCTQPAGRSHQPTESIYRSGSPTTPTYPPKLVVLGDSNAHPTSCFQCTVFSEQVAEALSTKLARKVEEVNLAWVLQDPNPAQIKDILRFVREDAAPRRALGEAVAVLVFVSQNDLAYNRGDDPCGVAPHYPRIRWADLTHQCMDAALADYERDLDALLAEIDTIRAGRPMMVRVVSALNTTLGDVVDPTWNSPAAVEPSTYNVSRMMGVQCRLAAQHGAQCVDIFHILNGPDGRQSAQRFLNPADATHLAQTGHDAVAKAVVDLGFQPLVGP